MCVKLARFLWAGVGVAGLQQAQHQRTNLAFSSFDLLSTDGGRQRVGGSGCRPTYSIAASSDLLLEP